MGDLQQLALSTGASVAAMATAFSGLVYLANNWFSFDGAQIGRVLAMFAVGLAATVFAMVFANLSRPWLTSIAAAVAMITPTGFDHFANMMSLGLAVLATAIGIQVWMTRRTDDARHAHAVAVAKVDASTISPAGPLPVHAPSPLVKSIS